MPYTWPENSRPCARDFLNTMVIDDKMVTRRALFFPLQPLAQRTKLSSRLDAKKKLKLFLQKYSIIAAAAAGAAAPLCQQIIFAANIHVSGDHIGTTSRLIQVRCLLILREFYLPIVFNAFLSLLFRHARPPLFNEERP